MDLEMHTHGNTDILSLHKTAFLCSRDYSASAVLRVYDWAKEMRAGGGCVISGFHSLLERDVLAILLKGKQPLILAAARGLPMRHSAAVRAALDDGRLLMVSPFAASVRRITVATAGARNAFMLTLAERIVIGSMSPGGALARALSGVHKDTEIIQLTHPETQPRAGHRK